MNPQQVRAIIMVQQPIFRLGMIALLKTMAPCEIIGQPTSADEALELARIYEPEVAVLDTFCASIDMFQLTRQMRTNTPRTAVILLSELEGEEWLFQAIKVGAAAYVARTIPADQLIETIRGVSRGEYLMNDEVLSQFALARRLFQACSQWSGNASENTPGINEDLPPLEPSPLSNREAEILIHIAEGKSNKQIARLLAISDQTVKNHMTSTLRKLHVNDRTAAVVSALKQRWITLA